MGHDQELLERILTHHPSPHTLCLVLDELLKAGNTSRVIRECNKAIELYPDHVPLLLVLAEAYIKEGIGGLAEDALKKATAKVKEMARSFKLQAELYMSQGRDEEATSAFKAYLALEPGDEEAARMLSTLAPPQQPSMEEPTSEPEEPPLATPTLAEIYYQQGQIHEAIKIYEEVLAREPQNLDSARRLAELKALVSAEEEPLTKPAPQDIREATTTSTPDEVRKPEPARVDAVAVLESWLSKIQELGRAQEGS